MHTTYTVNDLMNRLCGSRIRDREKGKERGGGEIEKIWIKRQG
jgi:hypothetical protein